MYPEIWIDSNTAPDVKAITVNGKKYGPGDKFKSSDPCAYVDYINKASKASKEAYPNKDLSFESWNAGMYLEACLRQALPERLFEPLKTPTGTGGAVAGDNDTDLENPLEAGMSQSSGDISVGGEDKRDPAEQLYDPQNSKSKAEVYDQLVTAGESPDEAQKSVEKARKGEPQRGKEHPFRSHNLAPDRPIINDPVDLYTGQYFHVVTDFDIPSIGHSLTLKRTYRSGAPYWGPWGFNWDHSYNIYLRELEKGRVAISNGALSENIYTPDPAIGGRFVSPLGVERVLVETGSGYMLTNPDTGRNWHFSRTVHQEKFWLRSIDDAHGNLIQLIYDDEKLIRVEDLHGRFLQFTYGDCDVLEAVQSHEGDKVEYHHDETTERLVCVLKNSFDPSLPRPTESYYYHNPGGHAILDNCIIAYAFNGEILIENTFETDPGQAGFGRVIYQKDGAIEYFYTYWITDHLPAIPDLANVLNLVVNVTETRPEERNIYKKFRFNPLGKLLDESVRLARDGTYRLWLAQYRYDEHGQLNTYVSPSGLRSHYEYDEISTRRYGKRRKLASVSEATGLPSNSLSRVITQFTYEPECGHLAVMDYTQDRRDEFDFGPDIRCLISQNVARLTHISHSAQRSTQFQYDEKGQLSAISEPGQNTAFFDYFDTGHKTGLLSRIREANKLEPVSVFEYNSRGQLKSDTDIYGAISENSYDHLGRLKEIVNNQGRGDEHVETAIRYKWDIFGRPIHMSGSALAASGQAINMPETTWDYEGFNIRHESTQTSEGEIKLTQITDSDNRIISIESDTLKLDIVYDERGLPIQKNLQSKIDNIHLVETIRYNLDGAPTRIETDDTVTEMSYDMWGRLSSVSLHGVTTRQIEYDEKDNIILERLVDSDGHVIHEESVTRNHWNEIVEMQSSHENPTFIERDDLGRITMISGEGIPDQRFAYDQDGNIIESRNTVSGQELYHYDDFGRLAKTNLVGVGNETYTYNSLNLLLRTETDVSAMNFTYDALKRPIKKITQAGLTNHYAYDSFGSVNHVTFEDPSQSHSFSHAFNYDAHGRLTGFRDSIGNQNVYAYDGLSNLSSIRDSSGRAHTIQRDSQGRIEQETLPSGVDIGYEYDDKGRLLRLLSQSGSGLSRDEKVFAYNALGKVSVARNADAEILFEYDIAGRVDKQTQNGLQTKFRYGQNKDVQIVFPSGRVDTIEHNRHGLFESRSVSLLGSTLDGVSLRYVYDDKGRIAARLYPDDLRTNYIYDASGQLSEITYERSGLLFRSIKYHYNFSGQRCVKVDTRDGQAEIWVYDYDWAKRLIAAGQIDDINAFIQFASHSNQTDIIERARQMMRPIERFDVDSASNRLRKDIGAQHPTEYHYGHMHRLDRIAAGQTMSSLDYDDNMNLLNPEDYIMDYDIFGQVRSIRDAVSQNLIHERLYDAFGNVVSTTDAQGTVDRISVAGMMAEEHGSSHVEHTVSGAVAGDVFCNTVGDNTYFNLLDDRFSLVSTVHRINQDRHDYKYDSFGLSSFNRGDLPKPRFGGHTRINSTRLYECPARIYDPGLGRFLQPDPLGYNGGPSLYSYGAHDPVNKVDSSGYWVESAWDVLSLGIGVTSLVYNIHEGNTGAAIVDGVGIALDTAALILPGVPGGAGAAIKVIRAVGSADDALTFVRGSKAVKQAWGAYKGLDKIEPMSNVRRGLNGARSVLHTGQGIHGVNTGLDLVETNPLLGAGVIGLSFLGLNAGARTGVQAITANRSASTLTTFQGDATAIFPGLASGAKTLKGRIWAQTEGSVYAANSSKIDGFKGLFNTTSTMPSPDKMTTGVVIEFTGEAAKLFKRHRADGIFSAIKNLGGQHKSGFGDLQILEAKLAEPVFLKSGLLKPKFTEVRKVVVTKAKTQEGQFQSTNQKWYFRPVAGVVNRLYKGDQSARLAKLQSNMRRIGRPVLAENIVPASTPFALFGGGLYAHSLYEDIMYGANDTLGNTDQPVYSNLASPKGTSSKFR